MVQKNQSEIVDAEEVTPLQHILNAWAFSPKQTTEVIKLKGFSTPSTAVIFGLVHGLHQLQHRTEIHLFGGSYDDWAGARGWCEIPFAHLPKDAVSLRFCAEVGEWMSGYPLTEGMISAPEGWGAVEARLSPSQWLFVSEDRESGCVIEKKFDRHGYEIARETPNHLSPLWLFRLFGEVAE